MPTTTTTTTARPVPRGPIRRYDQTRQAINAPAIVALAVSVTLLATPVAALWWWLA